ncbi:lipase family protein [Sorangium sp. So ce1097]|uniref:lipase family protein n=1 Tax=Sorangium sp. So ce1097 TaxID=3133330 RepID=UPI003F617AE6
MVSARKEIHDRYIAHILGTMSSWAYSDVDTLARVAYCRLFMDIREIVAITMTNPALGVDTTAQVLQSGDKKLVILCFSGTELQDFTDWLTDASARPDLFLSAGYVHGGFHRGALALWGAIEALLFSALKGYSICDASARLKTEFRYCTEETSPRSACADPRASGAGSPSTPDPLPAPAAEDPNVLEALYVTGHSLGGALAVIAAALLHTSPALDGIRERLSGVYTFGQPMVGYHDFADRFRKEFGSKLFRHVYQNDIVPRLPPRTAGRFAQFGEEYVSTPEGWVYRSKPVSQALTFVGSMMTGITAWVTQQFAGIPLLRWVPLPFSWGDHEPVNYLRTSQITSPGAEFV